MAIAKVASTGYLRGRVTQMSVVRGGAAPKMVHDEDHLHHDMLADNDIEDDMDDAPDDGPLDLSEIRAGVESSIASPVAIQVASLEVALQAGTRESGSRDNRARRAAEARMKGFEGDSCGSCGNFTLVRNGTCMKCNTCGSTSGCS